MWGCLRRELGVSGNVGGMEGRQVCEARRVLDNAIVDNVSFL